MALREAILQSLSCMLSANSDLRKLAEERMNALEVTDEYAEILLEIILTPDEALEERLMASVVLKQFIRRHWRANEPYDEIMVSDDTRRRLRLLLPMGLSDPQLKIRTAVADTLAHIAEIDFPEQWPNLPQLIKTKLSSSSTEEVDGAVTLLDSCLRMVTSEDMQVLFKELHDILHSIIDNPMFNQNIRSRLVKTTVSLLTSNSAASEPNVEVVQRFYTLLCRQLQNPSNGVHDFQLKAVIVRGLKQLLSQYSYCVQDSLPIMLSTVFDILRQCGHEYRRIIMNLNHTLEDENNMFFEHLVNNLFTLMHTLVQSDFMYCNIGNYLPDLVYWIILFQCITPRFEKDWEEDEHRFYNDDCDNLISNSIRTTLRSLLKTIVANLDSLRAEGALRYAVEKHVKEADGLKGQSYVYWWRILESLMFSLGNIASVIKASVPSFCATVSNLLTHWTNLLGSQAPMILQARIVWIGGHYSAQMTLDSFIKHITYIMNNIGGSHHHIIRISAIRALSFHCRNIDQKSFHFEAFCNVAETLFERLLNSTQTSSVAFGPSVDSIRFIINTNPNCTARHPSSITQFVTDAILKNMHDNHIVDMCLDVIKDLSDNTYIVANVHQALLHFFLNILAHPNCLENDEIDGQSLAFKIINFLVTHSPRHLMQGLVQQGFPVVYRTIMSSTDPVLTELGIICIQTYLAKATDDVCQLRDAEGQTGLHLVKIMLKQVLSAKEVELTSVFITKFIIFALRAIHRCKEDVLDETIRALVSKIHIASIMHYESHLVLVFAYLFNTNIELTSKILSTIPGPDGGSALKYIFVKWLTKHNAFFGQFEKKLSTVSLAKIMEYALSRNDERFISIMMTNNLIIHPAMHAPPSGEDNPLAAIEQEPFFIKIFRLLIQIAVYEIQCALPQEKNSAMHLLQIINATITVDPILEAITEPEDDLEYIYKIDIVEYIIDLLRRFSQTHDYQNVLNFMKAEDKADLSSLGVTVNTL